MNTSVAWLGQTPEKTRWSGTLSPKIHLNTKRKLAIF